MPSTWPTATDYRDAIQHPHKAFKDADLKACKAETNRMGVPRARAGAFANVYKMMNGQAVYAVRVFLFPEKERELRYASVSDHLQRIRPQCMVNFRYDPQGIQIDGQWFPILRMDWVKGNSLGEWVRISAQARDARRLSQMAERWVKLNDELRQSQIAHGDLQHDNVMVRNDQPRNDQPVLVDYDCMCVPRLVGETALELGKPAYQHPERRNQKLSLDLDHFSAWIIWIALRAMACDLSLYDRYVAQTKNENLLFTEDDINEPGRSALWKELLSFRDPELKDWARKLYDILPNSPFQQIPAFVVDPAGALRELCQAASRKWDLIWDLAIKLGPKVPSNLSSTIDEARRRVACRAAVEKAIQARSLRQLASAYDPKLLDDWADCAGLVLKAREAPGLLIVLDQLEGTAKAVGNGRRLVAAWGVHAVKLQDIVEADQVKRIAEVWKKKIDACNALLKVVNQQAASERSIADAWQRLAQAGGHPEGDLYRQRGEEARPRADMIDKLKAIPISENEDCDKQLQNAWNGPLLDNCPEAAPLAARANLARKRLAAFDVLVKTIEQADRGAIGEKDVVEAAQKLPPSYSNHLSVRVKVALDRIAACVNFLSLLKQPSALERNIADAWLRLVQVGGHRDAIPYRQRGQQAQLRADLIDKLRSIPNVEAEDCDQQLHNSWNDSLLANCAEAVPLGSRVDRALNRLRLLDFLIKVIERANQGQENEQAVLSAAGKLPAGYCTRLAARLAIAAERVAALTNLMGELGVTPQSEFAIVQAWDKARATGLARIDPAVNHRCELAQRRCECLRTVAAIEHQAPLDEQDVRWLQEWKLTLLKDCYDAGTYLPRYQEAAERWRAWKTLERVIQSKDLLGIREAVASPLLTDYPPVVRQRTLIDELIQQAVMAERVVKVMNQGNSAQFFTPEDVHFIRNNRSLIEPFRVRIEAFARAWLMSVQLVPGDPPFLPAANGALVLARWTCPHFGRLSHCCVAVDRKFHTSPAGVPTLKVDAESHRHYGGGVQVPVMGQTTMCLTVWPVVHLGWDPPLIGRPLNLGPVPKNLLKGSLAGRWF